MDKKKWTYVLIVVVSGLWIYNIYKTVQTLKSPENSTADLSDNYLSFNVRNSDKDTFLLILPNKDPFLAGGFSQSNIGSINEHINKAPKQAPPEKVIPQKTIWPKIQYYGFVKNRTQDHSLCVINIDSKLHKMAVGESFNDLKILSATRDSLQVQFKTEIKSIPK